MLRKKRKKYLRQEEKKKKKICVHVESNLDQHDLEFDVLTALPSIHHK